MSDRKLTESAALFVKAKKLIPGQSQTFSKGPTQFVQGISPNFCERAEGAYIWDVDGNRYVDYIMALGPITLGYCNEEVDAAVIEQVKKGPIFSLPHRLEVEVAEILSEIIPSAEMVRFGKNGSDVTSAAVRIARAYTGRDKIACCGYHGWQDWYIGSTTRNLGVPQSTQELTLPFRYNDINSLKKIFDENPGEVGCVIIEAIGVDEPKDDFLRKVKELSHSKGAILVFDEMKTGAHFALGGVQEFTGIVPDISTWGKGIANGYPLSAIVGKREIMEYVDKTFFSFTFGGEAVSLAACKKTIEIIKRDKVVDHIWKIGQQFKEKFNAVCQKNDLLEHIYCNGYPCHFVTEFRGKDEHEELLLKSVLHQEMVLRGNLTIGSYDFCLAHAESDIDKTIADLNEVLLLIKSAVRQNNLIDHLKGEMVKPVFRRP